MGELIGASGLAQLLNVHVVSVYRMARQARLPSPMKLNPMRWDREALGRLNLGSIKGDRSPALNVGRPRTTRTVRELEAENAGLRAALAAATITIKGKARPDGTYLTTCSPGKRVVLCGFDGWFLTQEGFAEILPRDTKASPTPKDAGL